MSVINHKIWRDLWHNKGRTFQIVLIIAMGAFAIGMIIGSSGLMWERMTGPTDPGEQRLDFYDDHECGRFRQLHVWRFALLHSSLRGDPEF